MLELCVRAYEHFELASTQMHTERHLRIFRLNARRRFTPKHANKRLCVTYGGLRYYRCIANDTNKMYSDSTSGHRIFCAIISVGPYQHALLYNKSLVKHGFRYTDRNTLQNFLDSICSSSFVFKHI